MSDIHRYPRPVEADDASPILEKERIPKKEVPEKVPVEEEDREWAGPRRTIETDLEGNGLPIRNGFIGSDDDWRSY